jgi:hypothetical protein
VGQTKPGIVGSAMPELPDINAYMHALDERASAVFKRKSQ